ncbi:MAG: NINE protein [Cyclobacteriaceae bacterium]
MSDPILTNIPSIENEEYQYVKQLTEPMSGEQLQNFLMIYRERRKKPDTILLANLLGFLGVAGVHRFLINQIGMGLLYLLTGGLCLIGTIVDIINYKRLATDYNREVAREVTGMVELR